MPLKNSHALVIGVARYRAVRPLPPAVANDAAQIVQLLSDAAAGGYEHVTPLVDGAATESAIRAALVSLAAAGPDATIFIYFSGHGGTRNDDGGAAQHFLLP